MHKRETTLGPTLLRTSKGYFGFWMVVLICFGSYISWAQAPASVSGLTLDLTITAAGGGNNGSGSYTIAFSPSVYTIVYNGQTKTGSYTYSVANASTGIVLATAGDHTNTIHFYFTSSNDGTYASTNTLGQYEDGLFTVASSRPLLGAPQVNTANGQFLFIASGLTPGSTNIVQASADLNPANWVSVATNVANADSAIFTNTPTAPRQFYRLIQLQ